MNIQIEGRHLKITEAIQDHVHSKIDHLEKYFDGISKIHVILNVEDQTRQVAEVVCSVVRGQPIVGTASAADLYAAIDAAVHKTREHLKKYKERKRDLKRDSVRGGGAPAPIPDAEEEGEE